MSIISGHNKPWQHKYKAFYTSEQQLFNLVDFLLLLPYLALARLVDIERRTRPDPNTVPKGTPLCIADWCIVYYGCGTRAAFGIHAGILKRIVRKNDDGWDAQALRNELLREVLTLR